MPTTAKPSLTKTSWFHLSIAILSLTLTVMHSAAQGTAFTYQGQLNAAGGVANGRYDFQFGVYDAATAGAQQGSVITLSAVGVTNGLFTTTLDFGNVFGAGTRRWLSISVRTNATGAYTLLNPRQEITPTPYAITAATVRPGAVTANMIAPNAITGDKVADGSIQLADIDDGGEREYNSSVHELEPLGLPGAIPFERLKPVSPANPQSASISLSLPGGFNAPVLALSGDEGMSEVPVYLAQVRLSAASDVDAQVGLTGAVRIARGTRTNFLHGIVTAMTVSGRQTLSSDRIYTVRLESPLAALRYTRDYRVRTETTVVNVIANLMGNINHTRELQGTFPVKDQFIQFGESSFNFLGRLMEDNGIFYFVEHSASGGNLIIANAPASYRDVGSLSYYGNNPASPVPAGADYITNFKKASRQTTARTTLATYHFELPGTNRQGTATGPRGTGEEFDYINWNRSGIDRSGGESPAELQRLFTELPALAATRQVRNNLEAFVMAGESTSPDLHPGCTFTLSDRTSAGLSGSYLVTSVKHGAFARVVNGITTIHYGNEFEAIPSGSFRPEQRTPRPQAQPCTATVVGPAGETSFVDKYGRVKVQFHWDRYGASDLNSSAWIRVATPAAGSSGMIFIPQIGDEVLVSFLLGDPDAPVITGSLYNANRMPPYALPANKDSAGIRMRSSGDNGINELRFDNRAGVQQLSLNAARDLAETAARDLTETAARDLNLSAGRQINLSGPLAINGGTAFNRVQSGQAIAGPGTSASKTITFNFPNAFARVPKVIITAEQEPGWNVGDTFVTTVKTASTTSCTVTIVRVDANNPWNMNLRLNWIAWD